MNKKIKEMLARKNDLRLKALAVIDQAQKEGRFLTDEEDKNVKQFEEEMRKWDETIKRAEAIGVDDEPTPDTDIPPVKPTPQNDEKRFASFGEQMMAVYRSASPDGRIDPRLTTRAASGMNESVPSDGGFLVQQDFVTELLKKTYETGILASKVRKIPISTNANGLKINAVDESSRANGSRWGGVQAYWVAEAETALQSKPKFKEIEMSLQKLLALCYVTDDLLQDTTALEAIVRQAYADEMSFKIDDAIINGTGTGMPLGILNSDAIVTVPKEKDQAAGTIKYENILKMWSSMPARLRANAVWYINQEIEPQLYTMALNIGTGGAPVFMPSGGAATSQYSTLLNRPIIPIEQCSPLGKKGDIILADPTQYIGIDKKALTSDVSIHVRFLYDEQVFRFIYKFNGMPYKNKPIMPYKGANPLSPFVTLGDR